MILAPGAAAPLTGTRTYGGSVAHSLGPAGTRPGRLGLAAALVNSSNQVCGALGAALLNTIAAGTAASYLTRNAPHASLLAATVHGDVIAFTSLAILFAVGAVATAVLFPGRR